MGEHARFERAGALGLVVLDRPKAINSLTLEMVTSILATLRDWAQDDEVQIVAITGAGERGLCAGGDVMAMRQAVIGDAADRANAIEFWETEYVMDGLIGAYPKPVVAFMDGVVMGGGIGIAAHASHRIVTERSKLAMPETKIGFFPDVGGLHLLARTPGEIGTHLALTGSTFSGADAVYLDIADVLVDSSTLPDILNGLESGQAPDLASLGSTTHPAPLQKQRGWIDACYTGDDAVAILDRLRSWTGDGASEAAEAADNLEARSPYSVAVTLEALRRAARLGSLEAVVEQDVTLA
ncbi:MAG: 3-hydroxyisobutyryl-CoA hydrolase, partial [Mobilicoccus sp.]|nr:3-hydroxyisobutyryl-CoA hydrolase [Mobilicoccus sp.]